MLNPSVLRANAARPPAIDLHDAAPPIEMPPGYVGPAWLPGTGRMIWWTGRVAIGLRHSPQARPVAEPGASAHWVQSILLS